MAGPSRYELLSQDLAELHAKRDEIDEQIAAIQTLLGTLYGDQAPRKRGAVKKTATKRRPAKDRENRRPDGKPDRKTPGKNSGVREGSNAYKVRVCVLAQDGIFNKHDIFEIVKDQGVKLPSVQSTLSNLENIGLIETAVPSASFVAAKYRVTHAGKETYAEMQK